MGTTQNGYDPDLVKVGEFDSIFTNVNQVISARDDIFREIYQELIMSTINFYLSKIISIKELYRKRSSPSGWRNHVSLLTVTVFR